MWAKIVQNTPEIISTLAEKKYDGVYCSVMKHVFKIMTGLCHGLCQTFVCYIWHFSICLLVATAFRCHLILFLCLTLLHVFQPDWTGCAPVLFGLFMYMFVCWGLSDWHCLRFTALWLCLFAGAAEVTFGLQSWSQSAPDWPQDIVITLWPYCTPPHTHTHLPTKTAAPSTHHFPCHLTWLLLLLTAPHFVSCTSHTLHLMPHSSSTVGQYQIFCTLNDFHLYFIWSFSS